MLDHLKRNIPWLLSVQEMRTAQVFFWNSSFYILFLLQLLPRKPVTDTKPFPDPVLWAAQQMQVKPEERLTVGDTTVDIRARPAPPVRRLSVCCAVLAQKENYVVRVRI